MKIRSIVLVGLITGATHVFHSNRAFLKINEQRKIQVGDV